GAGRARGWPRCFRARPPRGGTPPTARAGPSPPTAAAREWPARPAPRAARPWPGWWAATERHRVRAGGIGPRRPPGRRDPAEQNRSPGILRPSMPPPSLSAPFAAWRARYASIVFLIFPRRKAPTHNGDDCVDNPPLGRKRGVDN